MATDKSTYERIREQVAAQIDDLDLITPNSPVQHARLPDDGDFKLTGLILSWDTEKEGSGTTGQDDIAYPCVLTYRTGSTGGWTENVAFITDLRQRIRREFHNKRLVIEGDDSVSPLAAKVQYGPIGAAPGEVTLSEKWKERWDDSHMIIVVWMRELREEA